MTTGPLLSMSSEEPTSPVDSLDETDREEALLGRRHDYLMLPGSDGRASIWEEVVSALRGQGSVVRAVDGWDDGGLMAQATVVAELVEKQGAETLVTWSYSGLVGAIVAARPSVLRLVVHVDSLLPGFATTTAELRKLLPTGVLRLIGADLDAATALPIARCHTAYVSCVDRLDKPSLVPVARSAALAEEAGFDVLPIEAGHQAMRQQPAELAVLLSELPRSLPRSG